MIEISCLHLCGGETSECLKAMALVLSTGSLKIHQSVAWSLDFSEVASAVNFLHENSEFLVFF